MKPFLKSYVIFFSLFALSVFFVPLNSFAQISNSEARKLCEVGDVDSAIAEYRRLLRIFPESDCLLFNLAICSINHDRLDVAEEAVATLKKLQSDSNGFHRAAGELAYKKDNLTEAKQHLERAVEIEPKGREYYLLARIAIKTKEDDFGLWRLSAKYYKEQSRDDEFSKKAWVDYASAAYGAHLFEESYAAFSNALKIDPAYARALRDIGIAKGKIITGDKKPLSVLVLLDKSRSMGASTDYEKLKNSIATALEFLDERDYLGVFAFDNLPLRLFALTAAKDRKVELELKKRIKIAYPSGPSGLTSTLIEAKAQLEKARTPKRHILVVTDGHIDDAPIENYLKLLKEIRALNITVSFLKVGNLQPKMDLEKMVKAGGGEFYKISGIRHLTGTIYDDLEKAARK